MKKTNNKLLLFHHVTGPTYKDRFLHNIKNYPAYKYFDILIMTDDVGYFDSIAHMDNLFIEDTYEMRKDYPWSLEHEIFPKEKIDDVKYCNEINKKDIIDPKIQLPTLMCRFALNWKYSQEYSGFIFPCLDVPPTFKSLEEFKTYERYYTETSPNEKIGFFPTAQIYSKTSPDDEIYNFKILKDYTDSLGKTLNLNSNYQFPQSDGVHHTFKIPNKKDIPLLFKTINNICKEVVLNKDKYYELNGHSMWSMHAEYIMGIVSSFLDFNLDFHIPEHTKNYFHPNCYPEDRFWNWYYKFEFEGVEHIMYPSSKGKEHFIQNNFESLKAFYILRNIIPYKFPYKKNKL